jgi:hypothetical protein
LQKKRKESCCCEKGNESHFFLSTVKCVEKMEKEEENVNDGQTGEENEFNRRNILCSIVAYHFFFLFSPHFLCYLFDNFRLKNELLIRMGVE